jgi:hypothetical protein
MDKIMHKVRLARWIRLVEQCQSGPVGQIITQWCKEAETSGGKKLGSEKNVLLLATPAVFIRRRDILVGITNNASDRILDRTMRERMHVG